jgi:hypothetical protein
MSLFNLIHRTVVIKFSEAAPAKFEPTVPYAFRLTGVDGMGFLEVQDLKLGVEASHEPTSEPYWINKDLVLELHEFRPGTSKSSVRFSGQPEKAAAKPKVPAKAKAAVS